jgi:hypothetical protein
MGVTPIPGWSTMGNAKIDDWGIFGVPLLQETSI